MFTALNRLINRAITAGLIFAVALPISVLLTVAMMQSPGSLSGVTLLLVVAGWLLFYVFVFQRIPQTDRFTRPAPLPLFASRRF